MLAKLRVQQKLTLLLLLPLLAVAITSVPFTVNRVDDALAASSTVGISQQARDVSVLMQDLQEERLLALTYLVSQDADREAYRMAIATAADRADRVTSGLQSPQDDGLLFALGKLRQLDPVREAVLGRSGSPVAVDRTYHDLVMGLVSSLELTRQSRADATGLRQMGSFEALLRINEDITRIGAALVIGTVDPPEASKLIADTLLLVETNIGRFRDQADASQNDLLALVIQGQTAQRINEFARQISTGGLWVPATRALTAAEAALMLTRVMQEQIARDIAEQASRRASAARVSAGSVIGFAGFLVVIVVLLTIAMSRAIAQPLRRLTFAATSVADLARSELVRVADSESEQPRPPKLAAVQVATSDEIGELARAFNRVQATAALLMEQQFATRRNTAVMFANVARRTRSLVSRQLAFIDDLERNEGDDTVLAKLYRLDHLTTRLHRSADSLLVVSGIREEDRIVSPAPLVDVVRSAIAEIEGYQVVEVGAVCPAMIAPELVPDLRLVLAEVMENAAAFSPPTAKVNVRARLDGDVEILVVDQGIGMPDDRLAVENRRLVERERLDVVPTSVLGLFVVGRLARRHGLRVRLRHGQDHGVVVEIRIPPALFVAETRQPPTTITGTMVGDGGQLQLPRYPDPKATQILPQVPALPVVDGSFSWFGGSAPPLPASPTGPGPQAGPARAVPRAPQALPPVVQQRAEGVPTAGRPAHEPPAPAAPTPVPRRPAAPATPSASTQQPQRPAFPRSAPLATGAAAVVPPPSAGSGGADDHQAPGLTRRNPGGHLRYFGLEPPKLPEQSVRDADAERDQLEAFARGSAEAAAAPPPPFPSPYPPPPEYSVPQQPPREHPASSPVGQPTQDAPPAATPPPAVPMASRGGLTRRVPGANLSEALRAAELPSAPKPVTRDPDAERDALHSFLDGLARAESTTVGARRTVESDEPE